MVNRYVFAVAGLAAQLNALPLNINLGAYSPALVVGDGEISFGGKNDVSQLMSVLQGAAVNAAQGAANGPTAPPANNPQPKPAQPATPAPAPSASVGGATPVTATSENGRVDEVSELTEVSAAFFPIFHPRVLFVFACVRAGCSRTSALHRTNVS